MPIPMMHDIEVRFRIDADEVSSTDKMDELMESFHKSLRGFETVQTWKIQMSNSQGSDFADGMCTIRAIASVVDP